ncbi:MAG: Rieske 2Fe-2S domain-containing protein [Acidobacteriales bacterium]|nr:Rieske 2Fe-2S domain-containing protein [Terriglobales bacterium]
MATTPDITGGLDCEESQKPQLKPIEENLQKFVHKAFASGGERGQAVKNFLNGTWIGEPLHVILTDIPIGAWTVALVFDGLDLISNKREFALAADASIGIGLVGAAGAAVTGVTDWQDADAPARRIGMIHGLLNITATALFATSLILRRRKSRSSGRILAGLGYGVMAYAAHLGGKMVYDYRVGVDRTDGEGFPPDFAAVMPETELAEAKPIRAEHDGVPILLVRRGDRTFALAETCSHFSGPLSEGKLVGDSIVCPWHKSRFALEDGRVLDGPAVHPQPCLQVRIRDGQIEVRKPLCNVAVPTPPTAAETVAVGQPA